MSFQHFGNTLEVQQRTEAENRAWHANLIVVAARYKLYSLDWTKRQKSAKRIKVQHICWDSWPNDQKGYKWIRGGKARRFLLIMNFEGQIHQLTLPPFLHCLDFDIGPKASFTSECFEKEASKREVVASFFIPESPQFHCCFFHRKPSNIYDYQLLRNDYKVHVRPESWWKSCSLTDLHK